jgi:hypothetical protein
LPHLIETISALEARGVGFRSLTESIDTTTLGGRLIFHVVERVEGVRKPVITADMLRRAQEHIANGLNVREAAMRIKVGKTIIGFIVAKYRHYLRPTKKEMDDKDKAQALKQLHNDANRLLLAWLEHPPQDRHQVQAFQFLAEAAQLLYAAAINLGLAEGIDGHGP